LFFLKQYHRNKKKVKKGKGKINRNILKIKLKLQDLIQIGGFNAYFKSNIQEYGIRINYKPLTFNQIDDELKGLNLQFKMSNSNNILSAFIAKIIEYGTYKILDQHIYFNEIINKCHQLSESNNWNFTEINVINNSTRNIDGVYAIMEHLDGGDLYSRIEDMIEYKLKFKLSDIFYILKQLLIIIDEMEKMNYFHLDIKPENILFIYKNKYDLKLIDFSFSKKFEKNQNWASSPINQRTIYTPPEFLSKKLYHKNSDIWCIGIIISVMIYLNKLPDELFKFNVNGYGYHIDGAKLNDFLHEIILTNDKCYDLLDKKYLLKLNQNILKNMLKDVTFQKNARWDATSCLNNLIKVEKMYLKETKI